MFVVINPQGIVILSSKGASALESIFNFEKTEKVDWNEAACVGFEVIVF